MPGPRPIRKSVQRRTGQPPNILAMAMRGWGTAALGKKPVPRSAVKRARQARP